MKNRAKRTAAVLIMAVLMVVAFIPSSVFAADTYTSLKYSSLDASVKYPGTNGDGIYSMRFNETGTYGAYCLQRTVSTQTNKNYTPDSLESFLTNASVSTKVRAIISQSVINESVSDVLSDLGLSASSFTDVTEKNMSTLWSNVSRGWNDLSTEEQTKVLYTAAQAAVWASVEGKSSPTFNFGSSWNGWNYYSSSQKDDFVESAALVIYNAYMALPGMSNLSSGSTSVSIQGNSTVGPTFPATYTFTVTVSGAYTGVPIVSASGYTITRTDNTNNDGIFDYSMTINSVPTSSITINASINGSRADVVALDCNDNHSQELAAMGMETYTVSNTLSVTAIGYNITTAVTNGTITPSGTALQGSSYAVSYTPADNTYELKSVTIDGIALASLAGYESGYTFTSISANHSISVVYEQRTITGVTVDNYNGVYDALSHSITVNGTIAGDVIEYSTDGGVTYSTTKPSYTNVGNYTVLVRVSRTNYAPLYTSGTVTITQAPLTVTADNKTVTYGDAAPTYTASYSGFVGSETSADLSGTLTFNCSYAQGSNAGSYTITPSGLTSSNYAITYANGTLTVDKAALTVTADNKTVTYGDAAPTYTASYSGFVSGDTSADLGGTLAFACSYTQGDNAGSYNIYPSGLTSDNYTITFINGTLTVDKAALTITADNKSVTYGDTAPSYTASYSGFVSGDTSADLGGTLAFACSYTQGDNAGSYTITPSGLTSDNYSITFANGTLTVDKAALTITADNKSVTYGDTAPSYTASYSGFVSGDTSADLGGTLAFACSYTQGDNAGSYTITPSGLTSDNYSITFANGTLTVDKAALTVTAGNQSVTYGDAAPSYTASYSGFVSGDTSADLGGTLAFACSYTQGDNAGDYTITPSGLTSDNYAITFANGTLTVDKAALTVTADNQSITYGDAAPTYTASYSGFVSGDTSADLGGTLAFDCSYVQGSDVGDYTITPSGLTSGNYAISYANGTLTVAQREITLSADDASKTYGAADPALSATISAGSLYGADTLNYSVARAAGENVGTYAITITLGENPNYAVTTEDGIFTINPQPVTLAVNNSTKIYGDADPTFTAAISGLIGSDTLNYTLTRTAGEGVGGYVISATVGANPNYTVTVTTSGTMTITPRPVTLTENSVAKTYGAADPAITATPAGLIAGDTLNYTVTRAAGENAGTYAILTTLGANPNYAVTVIGGTFTVVPAPLTITANSFTLDQGAAVPTYTATIAGFVAGDSEADLLGTLSFASDYATTSDAGSYAIIPSGYTSTNYAITYVDGSVTVNEVIEDTATPLAGPSWALLNLLLAIGSAIISAVLVITYYKKKNEDEEIKRKGGWRLSSLAVAIAAIITFILTEDMTAPMAITDNWTILMAIYALVSVAVMILSAKKKQKTQMS